MFDASTMIDITSRLVKYLMKTMIKIVTTSIIIIPDDIRKSSIVIKRNKAHKNVHSNDKRDRNVDIQLG